MVYVLLLPQKKIGDTSANNNVRWQYESGKRDSKQTFLD